MAFNTFQQGHRCPICATNKRKEKRKLSYDYVRDYIENIGYTLISEEYKNSSQNLKMICNNGHKIEMSFGNFQRGHRCKKCSDIKIHEQQKHSYDYIKDYIGLFGYFLISKDYKNINSKLKIKCPNEHMFEMSFKNFKKGNRCPHCKQTNGEMNISYFLEKNQINFEYQYSFKDCKFKRTLPFDFYIPSLNLCIEYDGKQHYEINEYFGGRDGFIDTKIRDTIKNIYCKNNNIKLLRIPYRKFNDIENILKDEILR